MTTTRTKVLLVEDDPLHAQIIEGMIANAGEEIELAVVDRFSALAERLRDAPPDLALLDLELPDSSGSETYFRLRALAPALPVIILTATGTDEIARELLEAGAQDYLVKWQLNAQLLQRSIMYAVERRSERQLRESEERLRLAMTAARLGAWEWNLAADRLIGDGYVRELIDIEEGGLAALAARIHADDRALVTEEAERLLAGGEAHDLQFRILDPAGNWRWVQVSGRGLLNESGRASRVIGILQEITGRKQAEEHYRLLSSAGQNSQDGILITTAQLDMPGPEIIFVNPAFCAMTGYRAEELIGATPRLLQGPKTNRDLLEQMREQLQQGESFSAETVNYRRDRSEYSVEWQISPVRDQNGEITHFISIQRNISARRRNEERLRHQSTLLDGAQDAIIIRDIDEGITYWNRGAERLYGWTAEEVRGRTLKELLHRELPAEYEKARASLVSYGKWHGELRQVTKDGKELIVECRWTAIYDATGQVKSILVINTDITEKKRFEAMAMRAQRLESIGALASGIAHDLNNVLAPILMALHTLQQRFTDENSQRWLSLIHKSAERGRDLIDQVLSFAKGVEGERAPLQISLLISDIEKILKETLPRNIELQVIVPEGLWTVIGDTTQIHQVLMNLCINARDAMPGGGRLLIKARNRFLVEQEERLVTNPKQKQYVRITVADTGVGIPPEIIDRVFDPFFTTKGKGQGSGLGLAMVQGIVRGHGGFVNVLSQPERGTEFKIYLPAQDLPVFESEPRIEVDLPAGNGELILVVDDEEDIREVTSRTLEGNGYRVLVARDGLEAVEIFRRHGHEIQLVLTDMVMPNLDGPGAIRALKEIHPGVRVVATSGVKTTGKLAEATQEGVKTFLPKPYTADRLLSVIAETLDEELPVKP